MQRIAVATILMSGLWVSLANGQVVQPPPQWHFGMTVTLTTVYQNGEPCRGLLITQIRQGGPANRAGLERHDVILFANNHTFDRARDDREAVGILQSAAGSAGGGIPTGGVGTFVRPEGGGGKVLMQVIDHRTNRRVWVTVYPTSIGGGIETFRNR